MIDTVKTGGRFRRRILLVDSNEALLLGCSDALLAEGYEVITARKFTTAGCASIMCRNTPSLPRQE